MVSPSTLPNNPPRWLVVAAFAAIYFIWGSTYLAIRFSIETIPPYLMSGVRFLVAGGSLYAWARLRAVPAPTLAQWRVAAVVGALLILGATGNVAWAEQRVPSSITALLITTVPLWVVIF